MFPNEGEETRMSGFPAKKACTDSSPGTGRVIRRRAAIIGDKKTVFRK